MRQVRLGCRARDLRESGQKVLRSYGELPTVVWDDRGVELLVERMVVIGGLSDFYP